jgi:gas vesicle protein
MNHKNHTHTQETHALSFIAGLLVGGMVGAGVMLMLAPQAGKKTLGQIQKKGIELRHQTAEVVEDVVTQTEGKARQFGAEISKQAKELEHRGKELLNEQKR